MFGLGIWELAVVLVVALLVLGPEKLPRIARQAGRALRELRRAASEFQSSLAVEVDQIEKTTRIKETLGRDLTDAVKSNIGVDSGSDLSKGIKAELRRDLADAVKPIADVAAEASGRPDPYGIGTPTPTPRPTPTPAPAGESETQPVDPGTGASASEGEPGADEDPAP